ncbi:MAG: hypothetical protein K8F62_12685 [Pseudorhodoplanes sp.]|nr:hypothetical protein [Pseudorhodoplanes sp.]
MIADLISNIDALNAFLRRGKAVNVNDQDTKNQVIALASRYFKEVRPQLVHAIGEEDLLGHDQRWQQLLRLAHGNNARRTYLGALVGLRRQLSEFNIAALATPLPDQESTTYSREEAAILKTLEVLAPAAAASYQQALADLTGPVRTSYRGTAAEFRESLREVLDHLAPDDEVQKQDWYKPAEKQTRPTMKQKVRYILTSRERNKTQRAAAEKMIGLIEGLSGDMARAVYDRASLATHVHQSKGEVQQIKRYVDVIFFDLLEISH